MIRKLKSGKYRLYCRKKDPKTGSEEISARSRQGTRRAIAICVPIYVAVAGYD